MREMQPGRKFTLTLLAANTRQNKKECVAACHQTKANGWMGRGTSTTVLTGSRSEKGTMGAVVRIYVLAQADVGVHGQTYK